jgi:hypothetical protein
MVARRGRRAGVSLGLWLALGVKSALAQESGSVAAFPQQPSQPPPAATNARRPPTPPPAPYASTPYPAPPAYYYYNYYPYPPPSGYGTPPAAQPPPAPPARPKKSVSLMIGLQVVIPIFEAAAEIRPFDHVGVAVLGGIGSIVPPGQRARFSLHELGGKLLLYPLAPFDRLALGGELFWIQGTGTNDLGISGAATGKGIGPFIVYKLIANVGFTLLVELGAAHVSGAVDAHDSSNTAAAHEDLNGWIPRASVKLGWSF